MKTENLWKQIEKDQYEETSGIPVFLCAQGNYLREETGGKVYGRCIQLRKKFTVGDIGEAIESVFTLKEDVGAYEDHTAAPEPSTNISQRFSEEEYAFEICSGDYKYRLFTVIMPPYYPVGIGIEEGIMNDIRGKIGKAVAFNETELIQVNDSDSFKKMIVWIFSSKRVQYVISNLIKDE